jgi:hypothetical protein
VNVIEFVADEHDVTAVAVDIGPVVDDPELTTVLAH